MQNEIEVPSTHYTSGLRVIMVIDRSKNNKKRFVKKYITNGDEEYRRRLSEAVGIAKTINARVYSSLNQRGLKKAVRLFKTRMLEADYYDEEQKDRFYLDLYNRWVSALMNPASKAEQYFLIDCDSKEDYQIAKKIINSNGLSVVDERRSVKGVHIITKPFNPRLFGDYADMIKKDGLILVYY